MTILDIAQSMKGRLRDGLSPTQSGTQPGESEVSFGTATADSSGGFVSIIIDGAPTDDPGYDPADYTFTVPCDSPVTAGDRVSYISDAGRAKAVSVATLSTIAQNADAIATATDQHFWADTNGVHVSTDDDDPAGAQNIVMNSAGVLLREGSDYLAAFTPSAVAFYDGSGNDTENIVASFGASGAAIGAVGTSQVAVSSEGLMLTDNSGTVITEIAESEYGPITEYVSENRVFQGAGLHVYILDHTPTVGESLNCRVSDLASGKFSSFVTFTGGTAGGPIDIYFSGIVEKICELSYDGNKTLTIQMLVQLDNFRVRADMTESGYYPPYFTFGTRYGDPGEFTATIGRGLIATNSVPHGMTPALYGLPALVCGRYNADLAASFIVGCGTSDTARKNAFIVYGNGNAEFTETLTLDNPLGISSGGSGQTGTSYVNTITDIITASSGVTISAARVAYWGKVAMLQLNLSRSSATSNGGTFTVGTVKPAYQPQYQAGGCGERLIGELATNGTLKVRNVSGSQIAANTTVYITFTYILP